MRTALLILILCMVYVFLCTYVPAYAGMNYPYVFMYAYKFVCMYIRRDVYVYVIMIALTALPCFFLIF